MRHVRSTWVQSGVVVFALGIAPTALAQQASPAAAKVAPEKTAVDDLAKQIDALAKGLEERGALDDAAKEFITKVALKKLRQVPDQRRLLAGEKLDTALDRIRDALSGTKAPDAAAAEKIRKAAAEWLAEQAQTGDPALAANAALLLADLRADGKPWIDGSRRLAELAATATLKPVVRAAAVAGIAHHADEFAGKPPVPAGFVEAVTPALVAVVGGSPPAADPASRWLVSRSLDTVARVVPAATPELVKPLLAMVSDPQRSTDERVRAAIALGRTATPESGLDAASLAGAVRSFKDLAVDALADSLAGAKDRALAAALSNVQLPSLEQPGRPDLGIAAAAYPLNRLEVERDAWRLLKLSEAIARPKVKKERGGVLRAVWDEPLEGGIGRLLDDTGRPAAIEIATLLRSEAEALVEDPTTSRVAEARETIATSSLPGD